MQRLNRILPDHFPGVIVMGSVDPLDTVELSMVTTLGIEHGAGSFE